jgi:hypothetical protein
VQILNVKTTYVSTPEKPERNIVGDLIERFSV